MRFLKTFLGSLVAKWLAGIVVALLAVIGFGSDYWVRLLIGWAADPLNLSLNVGRLVFIVVGILIVVFLVWPMLKRRFWPSPFQHVENIVLTTGMTPQTTSPVLLIADAKTANERLRVVVEYSSSYRALGSAGWMKSRNVLLADLKDVVKGQQIRVTVVTRAMDSEEIWWGEKNDLPANSIQKSTKYRGKIRFIGSTDEEQQFRFGLIRTSMKEAPYVTEVFTETDLDME